MPQILDPQSKALFTVGLFRPIDGVFIATLLLETLTLIQWYIFGSPTADQLIVVFLATLLFCGTWLGLLVLRVGFIVLNVRADIKLMPMAAAQLVEAHRLGNAPTMKKP